MTVNKQRRASYKDLGYKEALAGTWRRGGTPPGGGLYFTGWCRAVKDMLACKETKAAAEELIVAVHMHCDTAYLRNLQGKKVVTATQIKRIVNKFEAPYVWQTQSNIPSLKEKSRFPFWMCAIVLLFLVMLFAAWWYDPELLSRVM